MLNFKPEQFGESQQQSMYEAIDSAGKDLQQKMGRPRVPANEEVPNDGQENTAEKEAKELNENDMEDLERSRALQERVRELEWEYFDIAEETSKTIEQQRNGEHMDWQANQTAYAVKDFCSSLSRLLSFFEKVSGEGDRTTADLIKKEYNRAAEALALIDEEHEKREKDPSHEINWGEIDEKVKEVHAENFKEYIDNLEGHMAARAHEKAQTYVEAPDRLSSQYVWTSGLQKIFDEYGGLEQLQETLRNGNEEKIREVYRKLVEEEKDTIYNKMKIQLKDVFGYDSFDFEPPVGEFKELAKKAVVDNDPEAADQLRMSKRSGFREEDPASESREIQHRIEMFSKDYVGKMSAGPTSSFSSNESFADPELHARYHVYFS